MRWCRINPAGPGLHMPKREGDVGYDLEAASEITLAPGSQYDVPTNVRVQLPHGVWGEIRARSSIAKRGLQADAGVLDNGYTGPIFAVMRNMSRDFVLIRQGERVVQLVLHLIVEPIVAEEVDNIEDDPRRGNAAFGSTGV